MNLNQVINHADVVRRATVEVSTAKTSYNTVYTLIGDPRAVQFKIESLLREYPNMGYGTWAKVTPVGAIVTRSNSCD